MWYFLLILYLNGVGIEVETVGPFASGDVCQVIREEVERNNSIHVYVWKSSCWLGERRDNAISKAPSSK